MKRDWDWFRNQAMVQDTFIKVSQVVDGSMLLGEYILDRADRFMLLREEHVPPGADTTPAAADLYGGERKGILKIATKPLLRGGTRRVSCWGVFWGLLAIYGCICLVGKTKHKQLPKHYQRHSRSRQT